MLYPLHIKAGTSGSSLISPLYLTKNYASNFKTMLMAEVLLGIHNDLVSLLHHQIAIWDEHLALALHHDNDRLPGDIQIADALANPAAVLEQHDLLEIDVLGAAEDSAPSTSISPTCSCVLPRGMMTLPLRLTAQQ